MNETNVHITTERLILREWKPEDLKMFAEINRSPKVMEFFPRPMTDGESEAFYDRIVTEFATCGYGLYAVELKSTGEFIGFVGFHNFNFDAPFSPGVEIGWRLSDAHWGHGYAPEAAKACLDYAHRNRLSEKVYSFTAVINKRSERVMQKIGMVPAGTFLHPALPEGDRLSEHLLYETSIP